MTKAQELEALNNKLLMSERMGAGFRDRIAEIRKRIAEVTARPDDLPAN